MSTNVSSISKQRSWADIETEFNSISGPMRGLFDLISAVQAEDIAPESWHAIGNDGFDHVQKMDALFQELLDLHRAATHGTDQSA